MTDGTVANCHCLNPDAYGQRVVDICGICQPPVCEKLISEFFGNRIMEISPRDPEIAGQFPHIGRIFSKSSAHLFRDYSLIVVNKDQPRVKIRMDIFHENGHEALPWQRDSPLVCVDSGVDAYMRKRIEDEAFRCGIAMMMPEKMFRADLKGQELSEELVRGLAQRYDASLEVAARRCISLCTGVCAMLVCEPTGESGQAGLKIKYSVTSHRMRKFFHAGTAIDPESPLYLPLLTGETFSGLIHSDEIGPGDNNYHPYIGECFRFGPGSHPKVMALLWINCHQNQDTTCIF